MGKGSKAEKLTLRLGRKWGRAHDEDLVIVRLKDWKRAAAVVACTQWAAIGHNQHTGGSEPGSAPRTEAEMAKAENPEPGSGLKAEAGMAEAMDMPGTSGADAPPDRRETALDEPLNEGGGHGRR